MSLVKNKPSWFDAYYVARLSGLTPSESGKIATRYTEGQTMPLSKGTTKKSIAKNTRTEIKRGKDPKQASAIAYRVARSERAKKGAATRKKK